MSFQPLRTVRGRLVLAALLVEFVMLALLVGNSLRLLREAMGEQAREQAEQIAPVLRAALVAPLAQSDYATVQAVLDESHAIRGIDYLAVTDASGAVVATSGLANKQALPAVDAKFELDDDDAHPRYDLALPILLAGQKLGTLQFGLDLSRIVIARQNLLHQGVVIAVMELLLSAGLLYVFGRLITRQLSVLTAASLKVATGQLTPEAVPEGPDDVGRLGAAFNTMSRAIAERVEQLTQAKDATARMAASLQERTAQLDTVFNLSPDGFVAFDGQGCVSFVSPAFSRMTGLTAAAVTLLDEHRFSDVLAGCCAETARFPGLAALKTARQEAQANGAGTLPRRTLIELPGPDGRPSVLEVGLSLSQAGAVSQILFFRDVTHETEVDRMKSEFLSTAAHELRTPMTSIYGFVKLLSLREFAPPRRAELLGTIARQSEQMITIINQLLDLARIEARRGQDFTYQTLQLQDLVAEVVAGYAPPSGREPPQLAQCAQPLTLRGDNQKLQQALLNIVANAYKYSPGGGAIEIGYRLSDNAGQQMLGVQVRDHGIGMTEEQRSHVCERFYRADASGNIPGTGLGMSIVKEIVELHRGEVEIDSAPGVGTTVTLWFPAWTATAPLAEP